MSPKQPGEIIFLGGVFVKTISAERMGLRCRLNLTCAHTTDRRTVPFTGLCPAFSREPRNRSGHQRVRVTETAAH